jgi:hypothetical protein
MIVVIDTQYKENYGSAEQPYWKFKGGSSYKVVGFPQGMSLEAVVRAVRDDIEYSGEFTEEYIVGYSFEADDFLSQFERSQLEYDGEIRYPEPTIEWQEVVDTEAV